ncbi:hypothetical protein [Caulifigura coniformis]|uniref:hypothetical protein n=1 Tax=Caulifigura coniformis TaxID=2527983 RepID=UPI0011A7DFD1|nr:hypothetical protein [Caulifigura coniformis]
MFRQLFPALLGLIVVVQTSSSFASGPFVPSRHPSHHHHHHHHGHHGHHHHHHGPFFGHGFHGGFRQPQFVVVKKWTPSGWVYVRQPVGIVRF